MHENTADLGGDWMASFMIFNYVVIVLRQIIIHLGGLK
jgi:hypothetical protein